MDNSRIYDLDVEKRLTADVEEVGGVPAVQLDDVHGGHGEAGPIHQAPNVTVHLPNKKINNNVCFMFNL